MINRPTPLLEILAVAMITLAGCTTIPSTEAFLYLHILNDRLGGPGV